MSTFSYFLFLHPCLSPPSFLTHLSLSILCLFPFSFTSLFLSPSFYCFPLSSSPLFISLSFYFFIPLQYNPITFTSSYNHPWFSIVIKMSHFNIKQDTLKWNGKKKKTNIREGEEDHWPHQRLVFIWFWTKPLLGLNRAYRHIISRGQNLKHWSFISHGQSDTGPCFNSIIFYFRSQVTTNKPINSLLFFLLNPMVLWKLWNTHNW